jgi:antitoxin ParD1/3/4
MPVMTSMNISLPEQLKTFVEERVEGGGYQTASEYVRDLIRQDQEKTKAAEGRLEEMLLAGIRSLQKDGGVEATPELWDSLKEQFRTRNGRESK